MKKKNLFPYRILFSFLCLLILFLLPISMNTTTARQEEQVSLLSPHILRFHILANSDSDEDQSVKLEVRDLLFKKIYADLQKKETRSSEKEVFSFKQELQSYIKEHRTELEEAAEALMKRRGFSYPATIEVTKFRFPDRKYHGSWFPAGTYDAIRVLLGNGKGHNWWCVLYPPLSFSGSEAVKEITDDTLPEASGFSGTNPAHSVSSDHQSITVELHFKSLDWLQQHILRR